MNRLPYAGQEAVKQGLAMLEANTCLQFVPRTNEQEYLEYYVGSGCWSYVGRVTEWYGGRQEVSLGQGCHYDYLASHETMHALGFWHEQMRPDASNYVIMYLQNVSPGLHDNFQPMPMENWGGAGFEYDILSVMQYDGYAFSYNGQPTIVDRATGQPVPLNRRVSSGDYQQLNALYKCDGLVVLTV